MPTPQVPSRFRPPPSFPPRSQPAHADEGPYEAALKTCYDQFKANRETNANGGLKWSQNGVGYYSECLKRLNP